MLYRKFFGAFAAAGVLLLQACANGNAPQTAAPGGNGATPISQAVVLSTNPAGLGSDLHLNTSDNSNAGDIVTGPNPVFLGTRAGLPFVVNGDNTVTLYSELSSQYSPPTQAGTIVTAVLPASISGVVAGAASPNGDLWLADSGSNDVSFISGQFNAVTKVFPVGARPVAIAIFTQSSSGYVVNHDDNTVTAFSTVDNSIATTINVGAQPIWAVASADGSQVYVVNQGDGTVSVIDAPRNIVIATIPVGASPNFAVFDPAKKFLYVTNTGSNTLSIIDTTPALPVKRADVTISGLPISVAVLPDGSRAYAALGGCPIGTNHTNLLSNLSACTGNQVSVVDPVGLRESKAVTLGSGVVSVAASSDGAQVYAVNAHDGNVSIIRTSTDTELTTGNPARISAPAQNLDCRTAASCAAAGNQTPFMVRVFP